MLAGRDTSNSYLTDPYSAQNQAEFVKALVTIGIAEQAHDLSLTRGRGMLAGPVDLGPGSSMFAFAYENEAEIRARRNIDSALRSKALDFVATYDRDSEWILLLLTPYTSV